MNNSSGSDDCYLDDFDTTEYKILAGVRAAMGMVSLILAVIVTFLIIAHKKFKFFPQRLILFLALSVVLRSLAYIFGRVNFSDFRFKSELHCRFFGGFFELYASWVELIAVIFIVINIFVSMILERDISGIKNFPLLIALLLPLLWSWIPYVLSAYSVHGPWCGIRIHTDDCQIFIFGHIIRFALWEIPVYALFLVGLIITAVAVVIKTRMKMSEYEGHRYDQAKMEAKDKVLKSILPLLCYPFLFLLMLSPRLAGDLSLVLYKNDAIMAVWVLEAVMTPLSGGVVVVLYAFDSNTRKKLRTSNFCGICKAFGQSVKKGFCKLCNKEKTVNRYEVKSDCPFGDSLTGEYNRQIAYTLAQISELEGRRHSGIVII